MAKTKQLKIATVATTVALGILAVLFIAFAYHLFLTGGDTPYSRERVGDYLFILLFPSLLTLGLAVWAFILSELTKERCDEKVKRTAREKLVGYSARFDTASLPVEERERILRERNHRRLIKAGAYSLSTLLLAGAVINAVISVTSKAFEVTSLNSDVMLIFAVSLPLIALCVGIQAPKIYLCERSCEREIEILRSLEKGGVKPSSVKGPKEYRHEKTLKAVFTVAFLCIAVTFIVIGIYNGGMGDVLGKAKQICTECIGLG